ncbi:acetylcholine receptor subunit alpha-like isoform X3 [Hyposmocoma kahamanoa]|uniref:acetylcholine receptor subunit alpha-like isoform X3 n=1 Tax=Hyposmocoma kahamanoa TaxID=1477025 RepID=UPI000E6D69D2|nr:acetylcholine receptor subunit alpha-like isoform X3 [Hyposmocoma kahamanoa]
MGALVWWLAACCLVRAATAGNPDAKRLYDDLLSNYNKLVRPVVNTTDVLRVCIKLKLSQLIDVNLKNQIMTTNLWVEQSWYDYKLRWEPREYGGVHMLHVPSDHIWRPDIVLYNKNEKFYTCCDEPYLDITFNITMRRKTLFYTVNIIIPCMGISFLTVLTFYLPSDSGEKVTLSISILISLHVFFLLVVEIIPPTSLVVPLLGKYLIFAMILVSISICVTVVVLNVHFRSPQTHRMAPWVKRVFIHILPRLLFMKRPQYKFETTRSRYTACGVVVRCGGAARPLYPYRLAAAEDDCCAPGAWPPPVAHPPRPLTRTPSKEDLTHTTYLNSGMGESNRFGGSCMVHGSNEGAGLAAAGLAEDEALSPVPDPPPGFSHSACPPEVHKTCFCVRFIAEHTRMLEDSTKVKEDWKYVAMVLDRLFLWIFTLAVLVGTAGIILQAPTLYDDRVPIDKHFNQIAASSLVRCPPPA